MANQLKMAIVDTIHTLHRRGWSQRRIARELGIHRGTVARYLQLAAEAKPALAPTGSTEGDDGAKPALAPTGSASENTQAKPALAPTTSEEGGMDPATAAEPQRGPGRRSDCEPWRTLIHTWVERGLSAQRIYQDLVGEHGFTGSYYSVRRFVRQWETHLELPVRRLECGPGEEAQIDFGTEAPLRLPDGSRRRTHVFRIVLSYSRKAYSEVVSRQTTEAFLSCVENALWHFGGVPQRLVLDNLRAAVTRADWFDPELHPKLRAFAAHYALVWWPTRPYTPQHKGKIERGIGYVKDNALKGRTFASLAEQNRYLEAWERSVADTRIHGTTRRHVGQVFRSEEQPALQPLPTQRFPCFAEGQRIVHRDGHVEVDRAYYSVPPEYVGRRVWVRWDSRLVHLFDAQMQQITVHVKQEHGRFSTLRPHISSAKVNRVERGAAYLLEQVRRLGPHSTRWAEAMLASRGVEGVRVLQGLLSLAQRHSDRDIEHACDIAHSYGAYRLRTVRTLIARSAPRQAGFDFLEQDPLIRPLTDYAQFVHEVFQSEASS